MKFLGRSRTSLLLRFILPSPIISTTRTKLTPSCMTVPTKKNGDKKQSKIQAEGLDSVDRIKLFIDEDVHAALCAILRRRGFDVIHAQDSDRKGNSDREQLDYAVQQKRCLFSFNVKDYVLLHNKYVQQGKEHWGVIVSKQLPIGETLRRILKVLQRNTQYSMKNSIIFLSQESK